MSTHLTVFLTASALLTTVYSNGCPGSSSGGSSTSGTATPAAVYEPVAQCDAAELDPITVENQWVDGDELHVTVSYAGGCGTHTFDACWDGSWIKTLPAKVMIGVVHNANGDQCKALITEELVFDLSPVADETIAAFPAYNELIVLTGNYATSYTF